MNWDDIKKSFGFILLGSLGLLIMMIGPVFIAKQLNSEKTKEDKEVVDKSRIFLQQNIKIQNIKLAWVPLDNGLYHQYYKDCYLLGMSFEGGGLRYSGDYENEEIGRPELGIYNLIEFYIKNNKINFYVPTYNVIEDFPLFQRVSRESSGSVKIENRYGLFKQFDILLEIPKNISEKFIEIRTGHFGDILLTFEIP